MLPGCSSWEAEHLQHTQEEGGPLCGEKILPFWSFFGLGVPGRGRDPLTREQRSCQQRALLAREGQGHSLACLGPSPAGNTRA